MSEQSGGGGILPGREWPQFGGPNLYADEHDADPIGSDYGQTRAIMWNDIHGPSKRPSWLKNVDPKAAADGLREVFADSEEGSSQETDSPDDQTERIGPPEFSLGLGEIAAGLIETFGQEEGTQADQDSAPSHTGEIPPLPPLTGVPPTSVGPEEDL